LFNAGVPTTIEQLVWAVGQLIVSGFAMRLGVIVLAAHQVFIRIQSILSMFYLGFSLGAMTLVGKNLGADDRPGAFKTAFAANRIIFYFAFGVFVLMTLFAKPLIAVFTDDPEVLELGSSVLIVFALVQIPKALDGVLIGNLRGVGDLKWLMLVTMASVLFLEIGLNWFLVFTLNYSLMALWLVHLGDEILRSTINFFRFKSGNWKGIQM
jgi:Na+-driven multidrug efflux pump